MRECKEKRKRLRKNIAMSKVESIKNRMAKVKIEVEEKVTILGEKSEECVTVIEKAAKKSLTEMEEKLSYLLHSSLMRNIMMNNLAKIIKHFRNNE